MSKAIFEELKTAVVQMDEDLTRRVAQTAVEQGVDACEAVNLGLVKGMEVVGEKYELEEYFIPEVLLCSDAMNAGIEVLKPHIKKEAGVTPYKVVIGVVQGDTHDIGKNLVKILQEAGGFEVYDLGRDVPLEQFIDKAVEVEADIIGMSTLMTTTMDNMGTVITMLQERDLRERFKVLIGGGPISQSFADVIGADGYAPDATSAVRIARELVGGKK